MSSTYSSSRDESASGRSQQYYASDDQSRRGRHRYGGRPIRMPRAGYGFQYSPRGRGMNRRADDHQVNVLDYSWGEDCVPMRGTMLKLYELTTFHGEAFTAFIDTGATVSVCGTAMADVLRRSYCGVEKTGCAGCHIKYLRGHQFIVQSDHRSLAWLHKNQFHNTRLMRWSVMLNEHNFMVMYRPGADNHVADALSRLPTGEGQTIPTNAAHSMDPDDLDIDGMEIPVAAITLERVPFMVRDCGVIGRYLKIPVSKIKLRPGARLDLPERASVLCQIYGHRQDCDPSPTAYERDIWIVQPVSKEIEHFTLELNFEQMLRFLLPYDQELKWRVKRQEQKARTELAMPITRAQRRAIAATSEASNNTTTSKISKPPDDRTNLPGSQPEQEDMQMHASQDMAAERTTSTASTSESASAPTSTLQEATCPQYEQQCCTLPTNDSIRDHQRRDHSFAFWYRWIEQQIPPQPPIVASDDKGMYEWWKRDQDNVMLDECELLVRVAHIHSTTRSHVVRQILMPFSLRRAILHYYHNTTVAGHAGHIRTYYRIRDFAYWPSMAQDIKHYVQACTCHNFKYIQQQHSAPMGQLYAALCKSWALSYAFKLLL